MKTIVLILSFATYSFAAPKSVRLGHPSLGIVGGSDASRDEIPYQVSYQQGIPDTYWHHVCGGSIIAENWVITAGHCIDYGDVLSDFRVVAGILNLDDGDDVATRQIMSVSRQIVHEDFVNAAVGPNDLALVELTSSFTWNDAVQPLALPAAGVEPSGEAVLSGWGSTGGTFLSFLIPQMPNTLQRVHLPIVPYAECNQALDDYVGPDANPLDKASNVCTGPLTGGIATCSFDSGGPLAQDGTILGIVSWGILPCGSVGAPSVYTKVSNFVDWIERNINSTKVMEV